MTQLLKAVVVSLVIALSLTSDTALTSAAETAQYSSNNCVNSVNNGQMPKSWDCLSWTPLQVTLPCVSNPK